MVNQLGCGGPLNSRIPPQATPAACLPCLASMTSHLTSRLTIWPEPAVSLRAVAPWMRAAGGLAAPPKTKRNKNHQLIKKKKKFVCAVCVFVAGKMFTSFFRHK